MKGGVRSLLMAAPMAAPKPVASTMIKAKAAGGARFQRSIATAMNIDVKAATAPTERSIPPEMITTVMPTAAIPNTALSVSRSPITRPESTTGKRAAQRARAAQNTPSVASDGDHLRPAMLMCGPRQAAQRRAARRSTG